jgi:TatD DNase family protein
MFIDTHCHIYLEEFAADLDNVIQRAENEGVKKFFLPAIDSTVIDSMLALEQRFAGKCFAMMGLHPCSVKENDEEELDIVKKWLDQRPFAAVGEIGLDFYWDKTFASKQYDAFNRQMQWALEKKLPIVIHSRNAMPETIETVRPFAKKGLTGIFHCFGGTVEEAQQIIEMGFYLGIGGVITYKKAGLDQVLPHINLEHIVLETDAPYLTPVPFRGKRNECSYLKYIIDKLAEIKSCTREEIETVTTANAERVLRIMNVEL